LVSAIVTKKYTKYMIVPVATKANGDCIKKVASTIIEIERKKQSLYLALLTAMNSTGVKLRSRCLIIFFVGDFS
jgi:hypothetical protein